MARRDAVVQPYQFDPESDPEGEAPEEIHWHRIQQDVSEWLVRLNMWLSSLIILLGGKARGDEGTCMQAYLPIGISITPTP